jgi:hypothetical protein
MRKKRVYTIVAVSIFLLATFYFLYYIFLLDDERKEILTTLDADNSSIEIYIANVNSEKRFIQYCHFNNCNKYVSLQFGNMKENDFNGLGKYRLEFEFSKFPMYSWGKKEKVQSWRIKEVEDNVEDVKIEDYLEPLEVILTNNYLWEVYITNISPTTKNFNDVNKLSPVILNWEYTKSLYMLHELGDKLENQKIQKFFDREIVYLNDNFTEVINNNNLEKMGFPQAYILELIDLGLSDKYLSLIEEYVVEDFFEESIDLANDSKKELLIGEEYYSDDYRSVIQYADYYKIFSEHGYTELAKYSYNQMVNVYNMSPYRSYGLCSVFDSAIDDAILREQMLDILEPVLANDQNELIEGNLYELLKCQRVVEKENRDVEKIDSAISRLVSMMSMDIEEGSILVREIQDVTSEGEELSVMNTYHIFDLLMYLLYMYE